MLNVRKHAPPGTGSLIWNVLLLCISITNDSTVSQKTFFTPVILGFSRLKLVELYDGRHRKLDFFSCPFLIGHEKWFKPFRKVDVEAPLLT